MDMVTVDQATLIVTIATAVSLLMQQVIKPIFEATPLGQPIDSAAHDAILRALVIALNGGALYLLSQTTPLFAGTPWYDLLIYTVGQSIGSHAVFKLSQQTAPPLEPDAGSAPVATLQPPMMGGPGNYTTTAARADLFRPPVGTRLFRRPADVNLPQRQTNEAPPWMTGQFPAVRPAPPPGPGDAPQTPAPPDEAGR